MVVNIDHPGKVNKSKLGHCENQIRPPGIETGQYPRAHKEQRQPSFAPRRDDPVPGNLLWLPGIYVRDAERILELIHNFHPPFPVGL